RNGSRRGGQRRLTYHTKVQFNGNLMVGKAYTNLLGLRPGDEFDIKLDQHHIRLIPHTDPGANISADA
ncbi:MAG: AbrB-like transcriptional regulator, partial [Prochlorococcaceae cyanobacterium]